MLCMLIPSGSSDTVYAITLWEQLYCVCYYPLGAVKLFMQLSSGSSDTMNATTVSSKLIDTLYATIL